MKIHNILLAFLLAVVPAENAKILGIFQAPAYSHQIVYQSLTRTLAERGHTLTVMTPNPGLDHPNVTEISFASSYKTFNKIVNYVNQKQSRMTVVETTRMVIDLGLKLCDEQLNHKEVKQLIANSSSQHFDLIILEYFNFVPMLAFAQLFNCPVIGITSMDTSLSVHEMFGNDANPVIHPDATSISYAHGRLTFPQRVFAFVTHSLWKLVLKPKLDSEMMNLVQKHFPSISTTKKELEERLALIMVNTHPVMGSVRPIVPQIVQLGFLHITPPRPLPENEVKRFLDASKKGVIYVSFGSNVKSKDLPTKIRNTFLQVFSSLKFDVLWKFEADKMSDKPNNVMISKWLPQADILAHPKVKMIICQGGLQTVEEAIDREVPLIMIPFIEEQEGNALKIVERGVGLHVDYHTLNDKILASAIDEILEPKYKENIKRLRRLVYDQPMSSMEKAAWWVEHVIRNNGTEHFNYPGKLVPTYQKYFLDIFGFLSFSLILFYKIAKSIFNRFLFNAKFPTTNKKTD